jgi:RimJ/RimL family protein N-acetyltransferase
MLRGERITLRALERGDAAELHLWHADHEFSLLDGVVYPVSQMAWEEFVAAATKPSYERVVLGIEIEPARLIGYVALKRGSSEARNAELGIAIERAHWNRGYGRDSTRTLLRFAFLEMNLHRVSLTVADYNERARRMYAACGFREEGRLREAKFRAGRYSDDVVMGILDREFHEAANDS